MKVSVLFHVKGLVQGVGFRNFVLRECLKRNYTGWVKNEPDGSVTALINMHDLELEQFNKVLFSGNSRSKVNEINTEIISYLDFQDFKIRY